MLRIWRAFAVSLSAVSAALALGLPVSYGLMASGARAAGVGMWVAHSLAALPTVVIGLTLYFVLSASGPLG